MNISELPTGSVIEIGDEGSFTMDKYGIWYTDDMRASYTSSYIKTYKFPDVRIVSVPWEYLVQAIIMLQDEYGDVDSEGEPITFETVFSAIAADADRIIKDKEQ